MNGLGPAGRLFRPDVLKGLGTGLVSLRPGEGSTPRQGAAASGAAGERAGRLQYPEGPHDGRCGQGVGSGELERAMAEGDLLRGSGVSLNFCLR